LKGNVEALSLLFKNDISFAVDYIFIAMEPTELFAIFIALLVVNKGHKCNIDMFKSLP